MIILAIKLKINIKRYDNVTTTFSNRSKDFKNVRRKFFKYEKNDAQFADEKFKHEKKKSKKKQNSFLRLFVITANKKNIMRLSVLMSLKMLK